MPQLFNYLFPAMWLCWMAYWGISSRHAKSAARSESLASRLSYNGLMIVAAILFTVPDLPPHLLGERFIPQSLWVYWFATALTAAGLLFSVWARGNLGTNWSANVAIKQGHELITSGPYAVVRHPIYTGLLVAIAGSAVAIGEWRAVLGLVLACLSLWRKLRLEEHWMRQQFGEAYVAYCGRVSALIPFVL